MATAGKQSSDAAGPAADAATQHGIDSAYRVRFEALYAQLRQAARGKLAGVPAMTLSPTVLVHEAFIRLDGRQLDVSERGPFLALAGKAMRCVLVDHIRARTAEKRGGELARVTLLTDLPMEQDRQQADLVEIEQGLQALEALDPRLVTVVECHFYAGMEFAEIALHLGISERTAHRDWRKARAFLAARMEGA